MQFVKPTPYREALEKVGVKSPIGSQLNSSQWGDVPVALRERAFFSSRVESVRFLQRAQDGITDFLSGNTEVLPNGQTALKTGGRAQFIEQMREFALREGMGPLDGVKKGSLQDITSERRLGLIFDIQTRQAQDFGYRKQGLDPDVLNEFPAQRFIRVKPVKEPRFNHLPYEDKVYLKTDPIWKFINADFRVPWGPFGFGCGHDVEDVDRAEAEQLGLVRPGERLEPPAEDFNDNLEVSTRGLVPELIELLKAAFGDQLEIRGDKMRWTPRRIGTSPVSKLPTIEKSETRETPVLRTKPVSAALEMKVSGSLRESVRTGLAAIDQVHDDGVLPTIPVEPFNASDYGTLVYTKNKITNAVAPKRMNIRSSGDWPALTAVHESGHFLDIAAIAGPGKFATLSQEPRMAAVLAAARETTVIRDLEKSLAASQSPEYRERLEYLLDPREIWARAYAQYITQQSRNATLLADFKRMKAADSRRGWSEEEFRAIATEIDKMFKELGWL